MLTEKHIIHENGNFWVLKSKNLFVVMKNGITHSTQVGDCGWVDSSLAIAYCNYQAKRNAQ